MISSWIDILIILFGVAVCIGLMIASHNLSKVKEKTDNLYRQTKNDFRINSMSGELVNNTRSGISTDDIDEIWEMYHAKSSVYYTFIQLIPLFPLLGLLGTVIGIMTGLPEAQNGNFESLVKDLSTALTSTLWGLIVSIVLKVYVSLKPSRIISDIDSKLEEYDRKYNRLLEFRRLTDDLNEER